MSSVESKPQNDLFYSENNLTYKELAVDFENASKRNHISRKCLATDLNLPMLNSHQTKSLKANEIYYQNLMNSKNRMFQKHVYNHSDHNFIRQGILKQPGKMQRSMHLKF